MKESETKFKRKAILERIESLEDAILKGSEYLERGEHSHWHGFRPHFVSKSKNGQSLPPHKDWVKNVFLPRQEKALKREEEKLDKVGSVGVDG